MLLKQSILLTLGLFFISAKQELKENSEKSDVRYREWLKEYKKSSHESNEVAMKAFFENLQKIEEHNARSNETYQQGLNEESDVTFGKKKALRCGAVMPKRSKRSPVCTGKQSKAFVKKNVTAPQSIDHSKHFPPVKNQGSCLSCWAFTAVAVIEHFLWKKGKKWTLSEQDLVDCSLNYGCMGGWPTTAFNYIRDNGIASATKYSYKGVKETCKRDKNVTSVLKIPNVCEVFLNGQEDKLKNLIAQYGPVSGALFTTEGFLNYKKGVFYDVRCYNHTVDHAITIVGYGTDKALGDYWIIRNSWGSKWGMKGYGWVARNKNNHCGIALYAIFPCQSPTA